MCAASNRGDGGLNPPGRSSIRGVAQRQCKRFVSERLWVQLLPPAPCPHSSTGRASGLYLERCTFNSMLRAPIWLLSIMRQVTALVRRRGKFETCGEHHAPVAQRQEASGLEPEQCQFESDPAHQLCPCRPTAGVAALKARTVLVRIQPWAPNSRAWRNRYTRWA